MDRRDFLHQSGATVAATLIANNFPIADGFTNALPAKKRIAMVGTGDRGLTMWGKPVLEEFGDIVEFVGLCDINQGRAETGRKFLGVNCPVYTDFDKMMQETKPEQLIVTTVDGFHHQYIIKGLEYGSGIITEKPLTIDESKCQAILDAEQKAGKKIKVTFNYRYSPHRQKIYEILRSDKIGKITSVDFHWYLDIHHGADYFRRWHRLRKNSGSLLVHKATHHFDLLNWWVNSEPEEVFAFGKLDVYGKNHSYRSTNCRPCNYKDQCKFYFDITKNSHYMNLYAANEKYDGYLRDGCVWREDIDIFDQMAVQIKYANKVQVSYSLTAFSPYEGYRISFNGTKGRLDAWIKEMQPWQEPAIDEIQVTTSFDKREIIQVSNNEGGHGGGDARLRKQIFNPDGTDQWRQAAGSRDGAMACLIGIAARNSIDNGKPIMIDQLVNLKPQVERPTFTSA